MQCNALIFTTETAAYPTVSSRGLRRGVPVPCVHLGQGSLTLLRSHPAASVHGHIAPVACQLGNLGQAYPALTGVLFQVEQ